MKKLISAIVITLVMLVVVSPVAQAQSSASLATSKAYANSQSDTASLPGNIGIYQRVSVTFTTRDSAKADFYLDTKPKGQATASWTQQYADSVIYQSTGTNYVKEIMLRDHIVERLSGLNVDARVRVVWRSSGNGVTSPTYDDILTYTK